MKLIKNCLNGFTLIEILVVISLIGVLSTLVLANLNSARERSRDVQRKSDAKNIQTALRLYYNDMGTYPESNGSFQIMGCGALGIAACTWGGQWAKGTTVYMEVLPADPLSDSVQEYRYTFVDTDNYTFEVCLENQSDDKGQAVDATGWCPSGWEYIAKP